MPSVIAKISPSGLHVLFQEIAAILHAKFYYPPEIVKDFL